MTQTGSRQTVLFQNFRQQQLSGTRAWLSGRSDVQKHTLKIQCSGEASDQESQDDSKICTVHSMTHDLHSMQYDPGSAQYAV